jgi:hypothetical protein
MSNVQLGTGVPTLLRKDDRGWRGYLKARGGNREHLIHPRHPWHPRLRMNFKSFSRRHGIARSHGHPRHAAK